MGVTVRSVTSMTSTVYVNTGEESLDFAELLKLRKKYRIEAILVSDTGDDNLVLQIASVLMSRDNLTRRLEKNCYLKIVRDKPLRVYTC